MEKIIKRVDFSLDTVEQGVFAAQDLKRLNPLDFSVVKRLKLKNTILWR